MDNKEKKRAFKRKLEDFQYFLADRVGYYDLIISQDLLNYARLVGRRENAEDSAICFVANKDYVSKSMKPIKIGDILYPGSHGRPTRKSPGNIFEPNSYMILFDRYGIKPQQRTF